MLIVDRAKQPRWHELWDGNPYLLRAPEPGCYILMDAPGARPYCMGGSAEHWRWRTWPPSPATIVLTREEDAFGRRFAGKVVIEANLKPTAAVSKQYPLWRELIEAMSGLPLLRLRGNDPEGYGVDTLATSIRQAAAVIKYAQAYVGHEGALHHLAGAFGTPAVVLMGGYVGPGQTGYNLPQHRYLTGGAKPCGTRGPCAHCEAAMRAITPDLVLRNLLKVVEYERSERHLPARLRAGDGQVPDLRAGDDRRQGHVPAVQVGAGHRPLQAAAHSG